VQFKQIFIPVTYIFQEQMTLYKLLAEQVILAFCVMHFACRCCKHWQWDVVGCGTALEGDCDSVLVSALEGDCDSVLVSALEGDCDSVLV
jgi:hypothetical protein